MGASKKEIDEALAQWGKPKQGQPTSQTGPSFADMASALGTAPPTPEEEEAIQAMFAATPGLKEAFEASVAVAQQQPSDAEIAAMFGTEPQYPQVQTPVQTPPTDPNDPWANAPERRPTAGGPILYFFTEDQGSREDCSIFYSRRIVVERPPGGKAQVDAALDVILKRKLGGSPYLVSIGKAEMLPDWNDPAVEAMVGPGGNVNLLVAALGQYGITAYSVESVEQVDQG